MLGLTEEVVLSVDGGGNIETLNLTWLPSRTLILQSGGVESYWDEFLVFDSVYRVSNVGDE